LSLIKQCRYIAGADQASEKEVLQSSHLDSVLYNKYSLPNNVEVLNLQKAYNIICIKSLTIFLLDALIVYQVNAELHSFQ